MVSHGTKLVFATSFGDRIEDSELRKVIKERNKGSFPQGLNILLQDLREGELPNGWGWGCAGNFRACTRQRKQNVPSLSRDPGVMTWVI